MSTPHPIKIAIDHREDEGIFTRAAILKEELKSKDIDIDFERKQLLCGDALCGNIVFERKEGDDFGISICDGRLDTQAEKLALNFKHIYYIFVGDIWDITTRSKISERTITGAQHHLIYKYGIKILYVKDRDQYIWALYSIIKRHQEDKTFNPSEHKIIEYEVTSSDQFTASLAATGIGKEKAKIIAKACNYDIIKLYYITEKELCELDGIGKTSIQHLRRVLFSDKK